MDSGRHDDTDPAAAGTEPAIRRALPGDADALALVGAATFLESFAGVLHGQGIVEHCRRAHAAARYDAWLDDADAALWLAEAAPGRAPVGYAVVARPDLPRADPVRDLELKRIYLLRAWQGGGTGLRLLAHAIAHACAAGASRLLLGVYAGNARAQAFYLRHGFAHLAERSFEVGGHAYRDHVMARALHA